MQRTLLAVSAIALLLLVVAAPNVLAQAVFSPTDRGVGRAFLLEENPSDRYGTRLAGAAKWQFHREVSQPGPGPQVSAEIEIPARGLTVSLTIRPNLDRSTSVSHFIEAKFYIPRDFQHGGISTVRGVMMKQTEQVAGTPLQGQIAKLLPNVFALGLSQADVQGNVELLYGRRWLEIAIVYANGKRALLAFEKGKAGEDALKQAFASWTQLNPQVAQAIGRIESQQRSQEIGSQADENERQRIRQERENLKIKFGSTYGVKTWTDDRALSRNPLVFRNSVVALFTVFSKMLAEDQALFVHNEPVVAVGAPASLFRDSENVLLAIEVLGNRTLKLPLGETTATLGQYVGVYKCERRGCEEVFGR